MLRLLLVVLGLVWCSLAGAGTSLAILEFDNRTGDDALGPLGRGLAAMLITDLSHLEGLRIVERERLSDVVAELELGGSGLVDPTTAAEVGRLVGASHVLTGSLAEVAPTMRVDARVVEVSSGDVVATAKVHGPRDEFFLLEKELANTIAAALAVVVSPREAARLGRVETESFDAFFAWSRALDALDRHEVDRATAALEEALAHDASFGAAKTALEGVRNRIAEVDATRRAALSEDLKLLAEALDARLARGAPWDDLHVTLGPYMTRMNRLSLKQRQAFASRVLGLGIPEQARWGVFSVTEWFMHEYVATSRALGLRAEVLAYGASFIERYPESMLYPAVKNELERVVARVEREDEGKRGLAEAVAKAKATRLRVVCSDLAPRGPKLEACAAYARHVLDAGLPPMSALEAWASAAVLSRDRAAVEAALAAATDDKTRAKVQHQLDRLDRRAGDLDYALQALKERNLHSLDNALSSLIVDGGCDDAKDVLVDAVKRFRGEADLLRHKLVVGVWIGDWAYAEEGLREVDASALPDAQKQHLHKRYAERRARSEAADDVGRAKELVELARYHERHDLDLRASELWEAVARAHPTALDDVTPVEALYNAANLAASAELPGALERAAALFTEVVAAAPDHYLGERATERLKQLHLR